MPIQGSKLIQHFALGETLRAIVMPWPYGSSTSGSCLTRECSVTSDDVGPARVRRNDEMVGEEGGKREGGRGKGEGGRGKDDDWLT